MRCGRHIKESSDGGSFKDSLLGRYRDFFGMHRLLWNEQFAFQSLLFHCRTQVSNFDLPVFVPCPHPLLIIRNKRDVQEVMADLIRSNERKDNIDNLNRCCSTTSNYLTAAIFVERAVIRSQAGL